MKTLSKIKDLTGARQIWLCFVDKTQKGYVCWCTGDRLHYIPVDSEGQIKSYPIEKAEFLQAHSKYIFCASENIFSFWTPGSSSHSVFFETKTDRKLCRFEFVRKTGRFILLWRQNALNRAGIILLDKQGNAIDEHSISQYSVFDLEYLSSDVSSLESKMFQMMVFKDSLVVCLPDGSLWSAAFDGCLITSKFMLRTKLDSPAVYLTVSKDTLFIYCVLGQRYTTSDLTDFSSVSIPAPVLAVCHQSDHIFLATNHLCFLSSVSNLDFKPLEIDDVTAVLSIGTNELLYVRKRDAVVGLENIRNVAYKSNDRMSPLSKLRALADEDSYRALSYNEELMKAETQLALAMYLKFDAIKVTCNVEQHYFPDLIEDNIVKCTISSAEDGFLENYWAVGVTLSPESSTLSRCYYTKSAPFQSKGTTVTLQLESPSNLLCSLNVNLILRGKCFPRCVSFPVYTKKVCLVPAKGSPSCFSMLVHRPLAEEIFQNDLNDAIFNLVGSRDWVKVELIRDNIYRLVITGVSRKHCIALHSLILSEFSEVSVERQGKVPHILPSKTITDSIQDAVQIIDDCTDTTKLIAIYESLRKNVSYKLPLM